MIDEKTISQVDFECALLIQSKKSKGTAPFQADAHEIMKTTGLPLDDVVGAMRVLARQGRYTPSITVNKVPILR